MTTMQKILTYFEKEDVTAVTTQVQNRLDSSQMKLLVNLLDAATEKAYADGKTDGFAAGFDACASNEVA